MVDRDKRYLYKRGIINQVSGLVKSFKQGMAEAEQKADFDHFFESDESGYALTLAYPDDLVIETARLHGIATQGRDKKDILKELFLRQGGNDYRF